MVVIFGFRCVKEVACLLRYFLISYLYSIEGKQAIFKDSAFSSSQLCKAGNVLLAHWIVSLVPTQAELWTCTSVLREDQNLHSSYFHSCSRLSLF